MNIRLLTRFWINRSVSCWINSSTAAELFSAQARQSAVFPLSCPKLHISTHTHIDRRDSNWTRAILYLHRQRLSWYPHFQEEIPWGLLFPNSMYQNFLNKRWWGWIHLSKQKEFNVKINKNKNLKPNMIVGVDIRSFQNQHLYEFKSPQIIYFYACHSHM